MFVCEALESRRMMSATLSAGVETEGAMLLPAVQAAREATRTTQTSTAHKPGPICDVLYSAAGNSTIIQLQPVVM